MAFFSKYDGSLVKKHLHIYFESKIHIISQSCIIVIKYHHDKEGNNSITRTQTLKSNRLTIKTKLLLCDADLRSIPILHGRYKIDTIFPHFFNSTFYEHSKNSIWCNAFFTHKISSVSQRVPLRRLRCMLYLNTQQLEERT